GRGAPVSQATRVRVAYPPSYRSSISSRRHVWPAKSRRSPTLSLKSRSLELSSQTVMMACAGSPARAASMPNPPKLRASRWATVPFPTWACAPTPICGSSHQGGVIAAHVTCELISLHGLGVLAVPRIPENDLALLHPRNLVHV